MVAAKGVVAFVDHLQWRAGMSPPETLMAKRSAPALAWKEYLMPPP
jgi:hypothetical protein